MYDIEVDANHCYRVGEQALVHNASCVNNRKGFIKYKEEDHCGITADASDYYTVRQVGAEGLITMQKFGSGSDAGWLPDPLGWNQLPARNRGRGHIHSCQLRGSGKDPRDTVALYQMTAMSDCENKITAAVKKVENAEV